MPFIFPSFLVPVHSFIDVATSVFNRGVALSKRKGCPVMLLAVFILLWASLTLRQSAISLLVRPAAITNYSAGQFGRRAFVCC